MAKFAFEISQRIVLPANVIGSNVQAVITERTDYIGREPQYAAQYLVAHHMDESGQVSVGAGSFSESSLLAAQPAVRSPRRRG